MYLILEMNLLFLVIKTKWVGGEELHYKQQ